MHLKPHRHLPPRISKRDDPPAYEVDVLDDSLDKRAQVKEVNDNVATVFSVVYVTASATFSGPTAGFVTLGASTTSAKAAKSTAANTDDEDNTTTANAKQPSPTAKTSTTSTSSAKVTSTLSPTAKSTANTLSSSSSSSSSLVTSSLAVVTSSAAASSTIASSSISSAAKAEATSSSSASATAVADAASSGLSSGAKAGVALVVIFAIGALAGLAYFLIRKKKAQQKQAIGMERLDDEKKGFVSQSPSTMTIPQPPAQTRSTGPAPRLSYRPTSQWSPSVLGDAEKAAAGAAAGVMARNSDPANPFGIHAQTVESQSRDVISPIPEERSLSPPVELQGSPVPSPTAANFNISSPATPNAEVGMASAVPVAALAGAAPGAVVADPPSSTVHRVQLEFKPSMDDELELKVGQIVRVLHEYDDGWALCIRMDRSQQGVAPRTCLSKAPLKPRPMGPPPSAKNGPRGPGSMGPPPRPIAGAKVRQNSSSSQGSAASQARRPSMAPSKPSSPTLAEQARQRSASAAASPTKASRQTQQNAELAAEAHSRSASMGTASSAAKSTNASGPSTPLGVPTRKPVPGQAL